MLVLVFFAFLAGIFTVLSPCVLPVLPIILAAGTQTGKWRPLGIICGLVLSFTFFTLAISEVVAITHIPSTVLRSLAILLILLFGLIMLIPSLSDLFAKLATPIADAGQKIQAKRVRDGFLGGFLLGIALGLLWTPCAGPILAAITTVVATQKVNLKILLITLAYSIGCAIPMFLIAYGSSKIIQSSKFLSKHSQGIRQFFGVIMILTAAAIFFHVDMALQERFSNLFPTIVIENNPQVQEELGKLRGQDENLEEQLKPSNTINETLPIKENLPNFGKAKDFAGITNWINSPPLTLKELHGKVVLIDFWTYSCINCLRTLPYLKKWYHDYKDKGFVIVGVHTPEFEFEKDPHNVEEATKRLGITYPVAQDNNYKTWQAYNNQYWPADYLIDQNGNIRAVHFGEGGYVEMENAIRNLLGEAKIEKEEPEKSYKPETGETYLGLKRGTSYTNEITLRPDVVATYEYSTPLQADEVGLKGLWKVEDERIVSEQDGNYLNLNFLANDVYLVLSGSSKVPVEVYLDGHFVSKFIVNAPQKYDICKTSYKRHQLSLKIPKGISAYAFTFGTD